MRHALPGFALAELKIEHQLARATPLQRTACMKFKVVTPGFDAVHCYISQSHTYDTYVSSISTLQLVFFSTEKRSHVHTILERQ